MTYSVKEIFYTLQGEGAQAGRPAVFCRFAGCNLWSGREQDRKEAVCDFCDTDFVGTDGQGGGKFNSPEELAQTIHSLWPQNYNPKAKPYVVFTGGEPALQLNDALIDALHLKHFEIAIETNGTLKLPTGIDWVCVSPKADAELIVTQGDELKLIYPQSKNSPEEFENLNFGNFFLQPLHTTQADQYTQQTIDYCQQHPLWRLSLQTHKIIGIP